MEFISVLNDVLGPVMHVTNSMGVVCAAPTGGSAGTLPGVVVTLAEKKRTGERKTALMLLAASAVGLIVARRATFAAEVAGCQVEIGAAGAITPSPWTRPSTPSTIPGRCSRPNSAARQGAGSPWLHRPRPSPV